MTIQKDNIFYCPSMPLSSQQRGIDFEHSYGYNSLYSDTDSVDGPYRYADYAPVKSSYKPISKINPGTVILADTYQVTAGALSPIYPTNASTLNDPYGTAVPPGVTGSDVATPNFIRHGFGYCNFALYDGSSSTKQVNTIYRKQATYVKD